MIGEFLLLHSPTWHNHCSTKQCIYSYMMCNENKTIKTHNKIRYVLLYKKVVCMVGLLKPIIKCAMCDYIKGE